MSDTKNIIIIGASGAGGNLVNELVPALPGTHRILLIDALDFAFWPIGSLRAACVPGWEKRVVAPLRTTTTFASDSIHQVIAPNKVVELKENSIIVESPFEGSTEIPFFKCIIATGAQQPSPMRPVPGSTQAEYEQLLVKTQQEIKQATKVLVVGAGATGVEFAGEVRAEHPTKSVTIVHSAPHVMNPTDTAPDLTKVTTSWSSPPTPLSMSIALEKELKALNIEVITNEKVNIPAANSETNDWDGSFGLQSGVKSVGLTSGKTVQADYVFISVGNKPNASIVEQADSGAIVSGLVGVDQYLRVSSRSASSPLKANYYAIGDCSSTPGWKNAFGAKSESVGCAINILAEVKGKSLKAYTRPGPNAMIIPLGPTSGGGFITVPLLGDTLFPKFVIKMAKAQNLFVDMFFGRFKGSEKIAAPPITA